MGNCIQTQKLPENTFRVRVINDDKQSVQKGTLQVTETDLIYTDSKTTEQWQWPLKFLRKYGCDDDVFSFEAGRKCPGGEGVYAFWTQAASIVFNMVARNINQGNLQPPGDTSPLPSEVSPPDTSVLTFPRRSVSEQPNYQNMNPNGHPIVPPIVTSSEIPSGTSSNRDSGAPKSDSPPSANVEPKKFQYQEVVFDKPPEEHPVPQPTPNAYTRIDFEKTVQYNLERQNGILPLANPGRPRGSTSSVSSGRGGEGRVRSSRPRINTVPSRTSHRSLSDSSTSSQSSLTESCRDVKSPRETAVRPASPILEQAPAIMSPIDPTSSQKPNYQNVNVGCGDVEKLTTPTQMKTPAPQLHSTPIASPGDSVAQEPRQLEYMQLDFRKKTSQSSVQSSGDRSPDAIQVAFGQGPSVSTVSRTTDTSMVNYGELNFSAMEARDELHRQREQEVLEKKKNERQREQEVLEKKKSETQKRDRAGTHGKK